MTMPQRHEVTKYFFMIYLREFTKTRDFNNIEIKKVNPVQIEILKLISLFEITENKKSR